MLFSGHPRNFLLLCGGIFGNYSVTRVCFNIYWTIIWITKDTVWVYVTTDGQSASLSWNKAPISGLHQSFITLRQVRVCWCGALSLTRGRVCRLQLLLVFASAVIFGSESRGIRDHILLSQIRDIHFRRLIRLAGLRWRYSTTPPYNPFARTEEKTHFPTLPVVCIGIRRRGNVFTELLPRNLALPFLLSTDIPQYRELHNILCTEWMYVTYRLRTRWHSNNALRSYAGGALFESRQGYRISWEFLSFSSASPDKFRDSTAIKPRTFHLNLIQPPDVMASRCWERCYITRQET
jgi:hypothetical protein